MPDRDEVNDPLAESRLSESQREIADSALEERRDLDESRSSTVNADQSREAQPREDGFPQGVIDGARPGVREEWLPKGNVDRGETSEERTGDAIPRGVILRASSVEREPEIDSARSERSEPRVSDESRTRDEAAKVRSSVDGLTQEGWQERGYISERVVILQEAENILAKSQGRDAQTVHKWPPDRTEYSSFEQYERDLQRHGTGWDGLHDPKTNRILMHESVLQGDRSYALGILAHEARHDFQDALIHEYRKAQRDEREPDLRGVSQQTVRQWIFAGPIPDGKEDFDGYWNHPREADAREYEKRFVEEFEKEEHDR